MDALGNMPDEPGYDPRALPLPMPGEESDHHHKSEHDKAVELEEKMALEHREDADENIQPHQPPGFFSVELLREVFLNPGLFLLFGAIIVGFISRHQGH